MIIRESGLLFGPPCIYIRDVNDVKTHYNCIKRRRAN